MAGHAPWPTARGSTLCIPVMVLLLGLAYTTGVYGNDGVPLLVGPSLSAPLSPEYVDPAGVWGIEEGLVGWYRFENLEEAEEDSTPMGTVGRIGSLTLSQVGMGTRGITFDGTHGYAQLPSYNFGQHPVGLTFALWARPHAAVAWARFFDLKTQDKNDGMIAGRRDTESAMNFGVSNEGVAANIQCGALVDNQWTHIAWVMTKGSTVGGADTTWHIYQDGVLIGTTADGRYLSDKVMTLNWLAKSNVADRALYDGDMDDIRVYKRALSAGEVRGVRRWGEEGPDDGDGVYEILTRDGFLEEADEGTRVKASSVFVDPAAEPEYPDNDWRAFQLFSGIIPDSFSSRYMSGQHYGSGTGLALENRGFTGYDGEWVMVDMQRPFVLTRIEFLGGAGRVWWLPAVFRIYGTGDDALFAGPAHGFDSAGWTLVHDQVDRLGHDEYNVTRSVTMNQQQGQALSIYVMVVNQIGTIGYLAATVTRIDIGEWRLFGRDGLPFSTANSLPYPKRILATDSSLVTWYKFDGDAAAMVLDSSGNGYHLTNLETTPPLEGSTDRKVGTGSVDLSEVGYLEASSSSYDYGSGDGITFASWVQVRPDEGEERYYGLLDLLATEAEAHPSVLLDVMSNGTAKTTITFGDGRVPAVCKSMYTIPPNEWVHMAWVFTRGSPVRLYVDGELQDPDPQSCGSNMYPPSSTVYRTRVALPVLGYLSRFKGLVDDLRVYSLALTGDEVRALHGSAGSMDLAFDGDQGTAFFSAGPYTGGVYAGAQVLGGTGGMQGDWVEVDLREYISLDRYAITPAVVTQDELDRAPRAFSVFGSRGGLDEADIESGDRAGWVWDRLDTQSLDDDGVYGTVQSPTMVWVYDLTAGVAVADRRFYRHLALVVSGVKSGYTGGAGFAIAEWEVYGEPYRKGVEEAVGLDMLEAHPTQEMTPETIDTPYTPTLGIGQASLTLEDGRQIKARWSSQYVTNSAGLHGYLAFREVGGWLAADEYSSSTGLPQASISDQYFNTLDDYYGQWIIISLPDRIKLRKYRLKSRAPSEGTPVAWRIYASNSQEAFSDIRSSEWEIYDEKTGVTDWVGEMQDRNFSVSTPNGIAYANYALLVGKIAPGGTRRGVYLRTWWLYSPVRDPGHPLPKLTGPGDAVAVLGASPEPWPLFDGSATTAYTSAGAYFDASGQAITHYPITNGSSSINGRGGDWVIVDLGAPFFLDHYVLTPNPSAAAANRSRAPLDFRVLGSITGHTDGWVSLDDQSNVTTWAANPNGLQFLGPLDLPAFRYYALVVTAVQSYTSSGSLGFTLAEWELYGGVCGCGGNQSLISTAPCSRLSDTACSSCPSNNNNNKTFASGDRCCNPNSVKPLVPASAVRAGSNTALPCACAAGFVPLEDGSGCRP